MAGKEAAHFRRQRIGGHPFRRSRQDRRQFSKHVPPDIFCNQQS